MKKKVLQLIGSFHQGGSERQAIALTRLLVDDGGFDVFAAALNKNGFLLSEAEAIGLREIPEFPITSFFTIEFANQVRKLARYLVENKIDIIHTHDFYTNVFGMAAAALARTHSRITSKRETSGMRTSAQETVERLAFRRSDAVVANSSAVREFLLNRGVPPEKVHVIHNGVDLSRFGGSDSIRSRSSLGLGPGRFITLVANLRHPVKNIPMFLRVARRISDQWNDVRFVIAGEGELAPELSLMAKELGVHVRVDFLGRCSDVPALLASSYACVLTSNAEGFSNSILEYMAAGRPVVATSVGGAAEAITRDTGFLVAPDDDAAMADCLQQLLADEMRAARMGIGGQERVKMEFSLERQIEHTVELYDQLSSQ
ncbi:MAG: glycosyltransferase [Pyrinomonadaceae bacterium]